MNMFEAPVPASVNLGSRKSTFVAFSQVLTREAWALTQPAQGLAFLQDRVDLID